MEVFHYARLSQIHRTPDNALYIPPRSVSHRTGSEVRGIFALLEPAPLNWVTNTDFDEYNGKIWQELIGHLKSGPCFIPN